jgi:uncharacterized tellurite resistance protein B-like protein
MHILAALAAAAGVVIFLLIRAQQATTAARDVADAASDLGGLFRRWSWRRRANVNPLDAVTDPREAAVAMMVAVAQFDGAVTEAEQTTMLDLAMAHFGATREQAIELVSRGRWLAQERADVGEMMRRLTPVIEAKCAPAQRRELIGMLTAVASASGNADETVRHDIDNLKRALAV